MAAIIKKSRVDLRELTPEERAHAAVRSQRSGDTCEKQVELVRDRGRVIAIQLTCSCGEETVVTLEYDEQPTQS